MPRAFWGKKGDLGLWTAPTLCPRGHGARRYGLGLPKGVSPFGGVAFRRFLSTGKENDINPPAWRRAQLKSLRAFSGRFFSAAEHRRFSAQKPKSPQQRKKEVSYFLFMILSVYSDRKYRKEHRKRALFRRAPFETPHGQRSATFGIPKVHKKFKLFGCITNLLLSKKQSLNLISSKRFAVAPHQTSPFAGEAQGSNFYKL